MHSEHQVVVVIMQNGFLSVIVQDILVLYQNTLHDQSELVCFNE